MRRSSPPTTRLSEPARDAGIQTALILALVDGEEIRVLNATEHEVALETPDPLPPTFTLSLAVFDVIEWEYAEFCFEHSKVVERTRLEFSDVARVSLGRGAEDDRTSLAQCLERMRAMWQSGQHRDGSAPTGTASHPDYGEVQSRRSYETFEEQRRAWLAPPLTTQKNAEFAELAARVEHAFSASTPGGYDALLDLGCTVAFKQWLEDESISSHGLFSNSFRRLYVGNEFCPHLFPQTDQLFAMLEAGRAGGLGLTVTSSYLMEHTVDAMSNLIRRLGEWSREKQTPIEIVVNDWGCLDLVRRISPQLTPILGKLLNKRKKDPRVQWYWGYGKHEHELQENALNVAWYRRFLEGLGVRRFEFDGGPMRARIPGPGHSLHYPYYYTNASVFCMLHAELTEFYPGKQQLVKSCPRYCTDFCYAFPDHLKLVGKGNAVFGFDDEILTNPNSLRTYIDQGVDRLVYMPDC